MAKNKVGYIKEFDSLKSIQLFLVNKYTRTIHYGNMDLVTKKTYNYMEYKMKEITNIPKRILELMKKHNIKTDYKDGVMSIEERKFILNLY